MNSLLPSPTLIDLSLRRDLHLIIVLQVMPSVPESFVEIGVWGGEKKKAMISALMERKDPVYIYVCVRVLLVFASPCSQGKALCNENCSWGLNHSRGVTPREAKIC